jgi:NADH-quinone oxidoreductase E subunit
MCMQTETTLARLSLRDHPSERNVQMISEQAKQRMRDLATRYPVARSAVMPALYIAQQEEGYITQDALQAVAEAIGLTVDDVESVGTFYTMYYQRPPGKKVIKVCTSISCYLRGCDAVVSHLEKRLGIKRGETSADGNYTFLTAECLASCGTAPVLQVNDEFVENITLEMVDALVDEWNRELEEVSERNAFDSSKSAGQDGNIKVLSQKEK